MKLLAPLKVPALRRLLGAYTINSLGTWLGEIALALLVLRETGSPAAVAAVFIAGQFAPAALAPFLTSRLETLPVRLALPGLLGLEAVVFAVIGLGGGDLSLGLLIGLATLDGVAALAVRAIVKASLANVAEREGLLREATSLHVNIWTACAALGPVLGGALVAVASAEAALLADAASFALAAVVLASCGALPSARSDDTDTRGRLRAGLRRVRQTRGLAGLVGAEVLITVLGAAVLPLEVVLVTDELHGSETAYGTVLALWGIGAVLGAGVVALLRNASLRTLTADAFALMAVSYLGMGTADSVELVCLFSLLGGIGNGIEGYAVFTAIQERTPEDQRVSVNGLIESALCTATGTGFLLGGALAALVSTRSVYVVAGIGILLLASAVLGPVRLRKQRVALSDPQGTFPAATAGGKLSA